MLTVQRGFRLSRGVLTKRSLQDICEELSSIWGIDVRPEGITEGGLVIGYVGYKSVRIRSRVGRWPWIPDGLAEMEDDAVIFPDLKNATIIFKSGEGARRWTAQEKRDVKIAIKNHV